MVNIITVDIQNFTYIPATVQIAKGDAIQWRNHDSMKHNAKRETDPVFNTGLLSQGQISSPFTFDTPSGPDGYEYTCSPHPGMKGKIIVSKDKSANTYDSSV